MYSSVSMSSTEFAARVASASFGARRRVAVAASAIISLAGAAHNSFAQTPTDTAARHFKLDTSVVRAGQVLYQTTIERGGAPVSTGWRTITTSETTYGGTPSWLVLETRIAAGPTATDSLILTRADLRPVHWGSMLGDARVGLEFAGDSLFGAVSAPQGRRSVAAVAPQGLVANQAMLELALRALPLRAEWVDSTVSLSLTMGGATTVPTKLVVTSEEQIKVPAGSFDCWVVVASAGDARATYWVAKQERLVVQSVQTLPSMGDTRVVGQLIRSAP
jgi:hypothetical protein